MASKSKSRTLTDHEEIRQWSEERGARPSTVRSTHNDDSTGIIRLDFPGYSGKGSLEEISWDEWFEDFEDNNLALIVQDETADGEQSNFNKLVSRDNVETSSAKTSQKKGSGTSSRQASTRQGSSRQASARQGSSRQASGKKSAAGSGKKSQGRTTGSKSASAGSRSQKSSARNQRGRSSGRRAA
jgi:hypothetical protein